MKTWVKMDNLPVTLVRSETLGEYPAPDVSAIPGATGGVTPISIVNGVASAMVEIDDEA